MQVTASHSVMFIRPAVGETSPVTGLYDATTFTIKPTAFPVDVPDWVTQDPYFAAARKSGWIVVAGVDDPGPTEATSILVGIPDEDFFREIKRRSVEGGPAFDRKARDFFEEDFKASHARLDPEDDEQPADDGLSKSSGQDGEAGDWTTAGQTQEGFPVTKGSPEDVTATPAEKAKFTKANKAAAATAAIGGATTDRT